MLEITSICIFCHRCYYSHTLRDSVYLVCGIFVYANIIYGFAQFSMNESLKLQLTLHTYSDRVHKHTSSGLSQTLQLLLHTHTLRGSTHTQMGGLILPSEIIKNTCFLAPTLPRTGIAGSLNNIFKY